MKKILIFSLNYFPKYVGGAEVAIKEIVERQDNDNYEFHMLTLRFDRDLPKYEILHGIHIHRIGFVKKNANISELKNTWLKYNKYYYQVFAFLFAIKLHLKYKYDGVWAMMAHSCGVPAALFKIFFPKVKYILTLQEGDPPEYIENLARPFPNYLNFLNKISFYFFKNAFLKADIIQSISNYLNNWATRMGNKNLKIIIPNAVNFNKFSQVFSESEMQDLKNKIGIKSGEIYLITTSRLVHKNAVDDVIESLKFLDHNIRFLIIGIGPQEEKLKKIINHSNEQEKYNLKDRVKFLGEIQNQDIPKYLKACDIFIRPSRSEGFGISFIEAMAAELPVIATLEGGIPDFLFDEKTGFVCKKDDSNSIAEQVQKIIKLKQENKLKNVLDNARTMVQEKYDWDIIAKEMEKQVFGKI